MTIFGIFDLEDGMIQGNTTTVNNRFTFHFVRKFNHHGNCYEKLWSTGARPDQLKKEMPA